ncbi:MAG: ferritin family protein [bacterium]
MIQAELKEIVQRSIRMEESSFNLYRAAAGRVKDPGARAGLAELAEQEKQHKARLERLLAGDMKWSAGLSGKGKGKIKDLHIGDHLEARPLDEASSLQDVLIVAIKREEATGNLYSQMAALVDSDPEKELFETLAREEARHKLYVESLYEKEIYKEF